MTLLSDLAEYACTAAANRLAIEQRQALRDHISDCAIALIAGTTSPEGKELAGISDPANRFDRIATATAIIRSTEADDIHLGSCTTPSSVAVPAAIMLQDNLSPDEVEDAVLVCIETMVRLGLAIDGPAILYRGIWPTAFATPLAVSALAARLWKLDPAKTTHALSLALMMSAGRTGRFTGTPTGRWIIIKSAVAAGIEAANAARAGYKGDPALLDGDWMERAHGIGIQQDHLQTTREASLALSGLCLKPFSTARQALGPTQALQDLLREGLAAETIQSIKVRVPPAYAAMISQPINPDVRATGYVSAGFQMALAALKPAHLWDLDRSVVMHDRLVQEFSAKVHVEASEDLRAIYPACWAAEIEVKTESGAYARRVNEVRGDAAMPLSEEERKTKTNNLLNPVLGSDRTQTVWRTANEAFSTGEKMARLIDLVTDSLAHLK